MEDNKIRRFRLVFEELVPEGTCKGSVIRRYANFPIIMAENLPEFSNNDNKVLNRRVIEMALGEFRDYALSSWDRVEYNDNVPFSYFYDREKDTNIIEG